VAFAYEYVCSQQVLKKIKCVGYAIEALLVNDFDCLSFAFFRHMYYTIFGESPHIGRTSLAGRNRQVLISSDITAPYDLALDFALAKLFWIDWGRRNM